MPLGALGLVLIAALCHSTWNLLLKTEPRRLQVQSGALATGVLLASPVLLFYSLDAISPTAWLLIVLSALFETGYVFALSAAYGSAISPWSTRSRGGRRRSWSARWRWRCSASACPARAWPASPW
jgi:hypothetical protein